jgi:hypothetical protein
VSTRSRCAVVDALPPLSPEMFPGLGEAAPLELPQLTPRTRQQLADRLTSREFDAWSAALARVGNCAHPIRLRGRSETVDARTGELLSGYASEREPLGVTLVRCGNRRASECPSCSRLYAEDVFHQIRAGIAGGKGVPTSVSVNPLVFATLTAPSFGPVHGRRDFGRRCHPHAAGPPLCAHGRPATCQAMHADDDPALGQPLCPDCYDYVSHVVREWWAPALWRRFTIGLRRLIAGALGVPATRVGEVATVQYAKVAEFQRRGLVHFHALIRLDGPKTADGFAPAPAEVDASPLAELVGQAAAAVRLPVPGVDADLAPVVLAFGRQLDARPVRAGRRTDDSNSPLTPEQVAGYLAKYATKSATDPGASDTAHPGGSGPPSDSLPAAPAPRSGPRRRTARTRCSRTGCTCWGSAATSPPSPAATRSPSARCAGLVAAPKR